MPRRDLVVNLKFFGLGTPRTGMWCEACLLPSGFEVDLYFLVDGGGPYILGVSRRCTSCDMPA